jgi:RNA polymerase sigma-70 factor (ECF subfamily)
MSLKKLVQQCKQQDIWAQERLYRLYSGKLFTLCLKYSGSYEEAEDNLQDSFLKIFEKIYQYKELGSFEGWMTRIVINTALNKAKQTVFLTLEEDFVEDIEVEIDEETISTDFLMKIIQELPERYRHVFNLYSMEGHTHNEIAEILKITVGTSKSNLARARQKLRKRIENNQFDNSVNSL